MSQSEQDVVVGIDLGTTNSEIAGMRGERVEVLGQGDARILPSCVALSPDGQLHVGQVARNQMMLYPERTVRSIKRRMGSSEPVTLGERSFSPQEISALILKALVANAEQELGRTVRRAVITVPAYFSDTQRQATREAGALAGLEVLRILNEPTAASLAYGYRDGGCVLVYDLGGGTFDVSIVTVESDVTEVQASHGNNKLGGDDFDGLLLDRIAAELGEQHGVDLRSDHPAAHARLLWALQDAKHRLSSEPHAVVREEALLTVDGRPIHLEREISRGEYEALIRPLVESTLDSVERALADANRRPSDLDAVLLVGGATRTPLVAQLLEERLGRKPRSDVHPDLCVALGAGVMASRLGGHDVERVLVDVSPYSFGPSYLGMRDGREYPHCYRPIIDRNTPLPVTRTSSYYTAVPYQEAVIIEIYQGENEDALCNIPVGDFRVEGLQSGEDPNEILVRMSLDLDGILQVSATEKATGTSKEITISGALQPMSEADLAQARERLAELVAAEGGLEAAFAEAEDEEAQDQVLAGAAPRAPEDEGAAETDAGGNGSAGGNGHEEREEARQLVERARGLLGQMHAEDQQEVVELNESIHKALDAGDLAVLRESVDELKEILYFVEGR